MIVAIDFLGFMVVNFINTHLPLIQNTTSELLDVWKKTKPKELACRYPSSILWELCLSSWKNVWHWCRTCTSKPQSREPKKPAKLENSNMPTQQMVGKRYAHWEKPQIKFRFLGSHLVVVAFMLPARHYGYAKGKLCCIYIHVIGLVWEKFCYIPHLFALVSLNAYLPLKKLALFQFCSRDACYRLWIMSGMSNYINVGVLGGPRCCWASVGACVVGAAQCHTVDNKTLSKTQVTCLI